MGNLPDELLLCPLRALQIYLSRTSSLSHRPCFLFASPRSPRPLSKNALSFFLRSVILQSLPSSSSSLSVRAHSICGMATSTAFSRDVSLPFLRPRLEVPPLSSLLSICVIFVFVVIVGFFWLSL